MTRDWRAGAVKAAIKRSARDCLVDELRELFLIGYACNVQTWSRVGVKSNVAGCKAQRAEARRLLRIAVKAVERAS